MIVLSKKKILTWIGSVSIFIITLTFFNSFNTKQDTVQTVNLPVTNKVIILDAGHGVPDERIILLTQLNNNNLLR